MIALWHTTVAPALILLAGALALMLNIVAELHRDTIATRTVADIDRIEAGLAVDEDPACSVPCFDRHCADHAADADRPVAGLLGPNHLWNQPTAVYSTVDIDGRRPDKPESVAADQTGAVAPAADPRARFVNANPYSAHPQEFWVPRAGVSLLLHMYHAPAPEVVDLFPSLPAAQLVSAAA